MISTRFRGRLPQLATCLLLLWAANPVNPYGYYVFLRWACCATFAHLAYGAIAAGCTRWAWLLGGVAALYNPILRVHLDRVTWTAINLATIGVLIVTIVKDIPPAKARD